MPSDEFIVVVNIVLVYTLVLPIMVFVALDPIFKLEVFVSILGTVTLFLTVILFKKFVVLLILPIVILPELSIAETFNVVKSIEVDELPIMIFDAFLPKVKVLEVLIFVA